MKLNPHPDKAGSALWSRASLLASLAVRCRQEDLLRPLPKTRAATKALAHKMSKLTPVCEGALRNLLFRAAWCLPAAATIWRPEAAGGGCAGGQRGRRAGASPPPAERGRCKSVKPALTRAGPFNAPVGIEKCLCLLL